MQKLSFSPLYKHFKSKMLSTRNLEYLLIMTNLYNNYYNKTSVNTACDALVGLFVESSALVTSFSGKDFYSMTYSRRYFKVEIWARPFFTPWA
jgi:hypothetical protein